MKEITQEWIKYARKDLVVAEDLFDKKRWEYCILFCHQTIEKILKAHIIEKGKVPPKSHDLGRLLQLSGIEISDKILKFTESLTPHYMPPRYPDIAYKTKFIYNRKLALNFLKDTKEVFKWLRKQLVQKR